MTGSRCRSALLAATSVALTSSVSTLALAQDAARTIANNGSILVDGRTFTVTPGTAKGDVSAQVKDLGARELGPGAIIFRFGDKLYIVDSAPLSRGSLALYYDPAIERQRPYGLREDADIERQRPRGLTDLDVERQRPRGLTDADVERQRPRGLTDLDVERQRPRGLTDADVERQRPRGLTDLDVERQRPRGLTDADVERQRPRGLTDADVERQRPRGLTDADVERQRPYGLTDAEIERQRPRGFRAYVNDPDYAYYRLKKTFEDIWGSADNK